MAALKELIAAREVSGIVVGMPRNMDGSYGERADITERFIQRLENMCHLPCIRWDERLSTRQAERVLRSTQQRRKRKTVRDRIAAQLILQNYLDYQRARAARSDELSTRTERAVRNPLEGSAQEQLSRNLESWDS